MDAHWQVRVGTARYGCGIPSRGHTRAHSKGIRIRSLTYGLVRTEGCLRVEVGTARFSYGRSPPPQWIPLLFGDVNRDNVVNILDLVFIGSHFGQTGQEDADVNGDGIVNILDLVAVAGALTNAAPSAHPQALARLTVAKVESWLTQAQGLDLTDAPLQRGRSLS